MARTQRDFTFHRETEQDVIKNLREQIAGDRKRKYDLLMRKRDEFIRENSQQQRDRKEKEDRERQENRDYKLDFFPFTYGEKLEARRTKLYLDVKSEMKQQLESTQSKTKAAW